MEQDMVTKQRDLERNLDRNLEKSNRWCTLVLWLVFGLGSMAVMLYAAENKTIVIADATQEQAQLELTKEAKTTGRVLFLQQTATGKEGCFSVPLPENVKAENVVIENRYIEKQLWVYIQSENKHFYDSRKITGDVSHIQWAGCEMGTDGFLLKFSMDDVMEYRSTLEENVLEITGCDPRELYSYLVVIDPAGGGSETGNCGYGYEEKELALRIAKLLQKRQTGTDVKLYFTRTEDVDLSREDRIALTQAIDADFYIGIGAAEYPQDEQSYGIKCYYNENCFIPGFGNVDLADLVTRDVTIAASNRALGLYHMEEGSILKDLNLPAAQLSVGCLSNDKERALLKQDSYLEKIADGILKAIQESCQKLSEQQMEKTGWQG